MEIVREERRGVLFYVCPEMREAGFPHGFSTRGGGRVSRPLGQPEPGGELRRRPGAGEQRTSAASAPPSGQTRTAW